MAEILAPRSFTDTRGRKWLVEINVTAVKRVRVATGVEIGKWASDKFRSLAALLEDV